MRYITIEKCSYCQYKKVGRAWQDSYCEKIGRDITLEEEKKAFPPWCPLPVLEEMEAKP